MTKYKIGDKVVIRDDLNLEDYYYMEESGECDTVVSDMLKLAGMTVTISDIRSGKYKINELSNYYFTDEMIVGKVEDVVEDEDDIDEIFGEIKELLNGATVLMEKTSDKELKPEMKYKVGDRVRISRNLIKHTPYFSEIKPSNRYYVVDNMESCRGKVAKIEKVDCVEGTYSIDLDNNEWNWTEDMFDQLVKNETIITELSASLNIVAEKVIYSDLATIMFYKVVTETEYGFPNYGKLKKVVAKCSPDDDFSKEKGVEVCVAKALQKELKRIMKSF